MKPEAQEMLTSSALKILHSRLTLIFPHYTGGPEGQATTPKGKWIQGLMAKVAHLIVTVEE